MLQQTFDLGQQCFVEYLLSTRCYAENYMTENIKMAPHLEIHSLIGKQYEYKKAPLCITASRIERVQVKRDHRKGRLKRMLAEKRCIT